jgi:hypothetical protein
MPVTPIVMTPGLGLRLMSGVAAGAVVAGADHLALHGTVSPVVVVGLLLALTAASGAIWGWRGWITAASAWACLPLAHMAKHVFGLPGTLQPDTWESIATSAAFTAAVSAAGVCGGVLWRAAAAEPGE